MSLLSQNTGESADSELPKKVTIVRVSSKGQFTIPKALRARLGMQPGAKVELWVEKGSLRAKALKPAPKQPRRS